MASSATVGDRSAALRRQRRRSTGTDYISALPEHLQHEVLSRVGDVKALFRLAVTCRGWLRRFTDVAFLRELCPGRQGSPSSPSGHRHRHRARLLGVFLQDSRFDRFNKAMVQARTAAAAPPQSSSAAACLAPVFLPALGSPLGATVRSLASFAGDDIDDDGTFDYAELLAARRGIVLVRLAPRTRDEMDCDYPVLAVCNPITGDRHVLPPLNSGTGCRLVSYAIITAADGHHNGGMRPPDLTAAAHFTFSQLLAITEDDGRRRRPTDEVNVNPSSAYYLLHSYSAATRRWSAPTACLDRRVFALLGVEAAAHRAAVVHRGAAHWLCSEKRVGGRCRGGDDDRRRHHLYRLSVELATARVSLRRLPVRVGGFQLLCVSSGGGGDRLAVASVYPMHVTVWTEPEPREAAGAGDDDDDDGGGSDSIAPWPRTSFRIAPQQQLQHEMWCDFNHGSLLLLFRGTGVFIMDLHTQAMEEVFILGFRNKPRMASLDPNQYLTCLPYEVDLVEFFTLLLGGIRQRLT